MSSFQGNVFFSFLEEKKQKKIICGIAFLLRSCRFHQRVTQNGRFVCEPSVFSFRAGRAGKHLFSDKSTIPQCLLFLFFKKRKRPLSFLSRKKRSKRKSSSGELLLCSSAAFANVAYKTDGSYVNRPFFRSGRDVRESIFSQINQLSRNVFCFFSSRKENVPLQEKKSFPLLFFEKEKKKPALGFLLLTILDRFSACVVRYGCSAWLSLQRRAEERRCGRA